MVPHEPSYRHKHSMDALDRFPRSCLFFRQKPDRWTEIPLVFLSTDLVFDGKKGNYVETDPVHPLSVYADTKVRAEPYVLAQPNHVVVRTSLNAGHSPTGDRAFNEEMRKAFAAGRTLSLFEDEFRCPIPAE